MDQRRGGHLYPEVQPLAGADDVMVPTLTDPQFSNTVFHLVHEIEKELGRAQVASRLRDATSRRQRAEGVALTAGRTIANPMNEDCSISSSMRTGRFRWSADKGPKCTSGPPPNTWRVIFPALVLRLTHALLLLAGRLADHQAGSQGQWNVGILLTGLAGAVPYEATHQFDQPRDRYIREDYDAVTTASTADLVTQPHAIVERLLVRLIRGLGVAARCLPYGPGAGDPGGEQLGIAGVMALPVVDIADGSTTPQLIVADRVAGADREVGQVRATGVDGDPFVAKLGSWWSGGRSTGMTNNDPITTPRRI